MTFTFLLYSKLADFQQKNTMKILAMSDDPPELPIVKTNSINFHKAFQNQNEDYLSDSDKKEESFVSQFSYAFFQS